MESKPAKQRASSVEGRVILTRETKEKLDGWIAQLAPRLRGVKVKRSDLVDWLFGRAHEVLCPTEISELTKRFFDPIKSLEWLAQEARAARKRGDCISMDLRELIPRQRRCKSTGQRKNQGSVEKNKTQDRKELIESSGA